MHPLIIRADASATMGTGHVMRCLALAQQWRTHGGQVTFCTDHEAPGLLPRLSVEGIRVEHTSCVPGSDEDARATAACADRFGARWIVVDGYQFPGRFQQLVRDGGFHLLALDDYGHADEYHADLVLNQNLYATEAFYPRRAAHTRLLLGTSFALLRREFLNYQGWCRAIPPVARRVLVTMGGSDPDNVTTKVIHGLRKLPPETVEATILIGGANPYRADVESATGNAANISLLPHTTDMPALMAWADVAVSASGSTCWELAFMGLPALTLVLAENQLPITKELDRRGVARSLGWHHMVTPGDLASALSSLLKDSVNRQSMSENGRRFLDGQGARRVVEAMAEAKV